MTNGLRLTRLILISLTCKLRVGLRAIHLSAKALIYRTAIKVGLSRLLGCRLLAKTPMKVIDMLQEYYEVKNHHDKLAVTMARVDFIRDLSPIKPLPVELMLFRSLFECTYEGWVLDPHLATTLGTNTSITFDDFMKGCLKFDAAVKAVYRNLFVSRDVKLLHRVSCYV